MCYITCSSQRNATNASFVLAKKIAKQNQSSAEAEFVKHCMVDAITVACPELKSKLEAISLSRRIIVRRIDAMAVNIHEQLLIATVVTFSGHFLWFSISLDDIMLLR